MVTAVSTRASNSSIFMPQVGFLMCMTYLNAMRRMNRRFGPRVLGTSAYIPIHAGGRKRIRC